MWRWWSGACSSFCVLVNGGGVLVPVCRLWWWALVGRGGHWSPFIDGAGGCWLPFVGSAGGRSSPLVTGAGVCAWVVVTVLGCWWWVAVVQWWPLSLRMVVAGRSWVVGVLVTCVRLGVGVLVCGHPSVGTSLSLSGCGCGYLVVCHIGGNEVAPGKREVRARGLLNRRWGCLLTCGWKQPDGDDVPHHHHQTTHRRIASTLPGLVSLVTWRWRHPPDVVCGVCHRWPWWRGVGGWVLVARRWWLGIVIGSGGGWGRGVFGLLTMPNRTLANTNTHLGR